ncbi:MAG: hypothetical protein E7D19_11930 [Klebsiella grimontii]|nr:hypothetical protein [Klebsiella grimontii]
MAKITVTFTITEFCLHTGLSVALTLLDENARLSRENQILQQRLARFLTHS